ncbi:MAG: murein hydrolase activator EnvC family protein [Pseudomonadota bacterium]
MVALAVPITAPGAEVEQEIDSQRQAIESTRAEREQARKELERHQEAMAELEQRAERLEEERRALERQREALRQREAELEQGLAEREDELREHLQAAYPLTRGGALQALLAEGDVLQSQRDLHYLRSLIEPIQRARRAIAERQADLEANRREIGETEAQLERNRKTIEEGQRQLADNLARQQALLADLGETLDRQQAELKSLLERKERLEREVRAAARAREQAEQNPEPPEAERLQGATVAGIPIEGRVWRNYGEAMPTGRLRQEGITFRAEGDLPVRAVEKGTVVYAGTLKGWGQLVMLRHPDNYLSLYAHCRTLEVSKGDRVSAGTTLCRSGTVDADKTGLYVEVRHRNRPVDPSRWAAWRRVVDG